MFGSQPTDGGHLILTEDEHALIVAEYPEAKAFFKRFVGSYELINGLFRWCLFLTQENRAQWEQIPPIRQHVAACRDFRLKSKKAATVKCAETPWQFADLRLAEPVAALVIPHVSSELRPYLPVGFIDSQTIVSDSVYFLPDATLIHFAVISSHIHVVWMRLTSGRLKSDSNSTVACPLWVTTTLSSILTWTLPLRSSSLW